MIRAVSPPITSIYASVKAMLSGSLSLKRYVCAVCVCLFVSFFVAQGQQQEQATPEQTDDVLRVSSSVVQTDVMVFDKQGRFIEDLQREQFDLRVDGKPQSISFFERIKAGSVNEDAQLAAARGDARTEATGQDAARVVPLDRGRVVMFYIDDLHLAADSMQRVRAMLLQFVDRELGQNDEALISSASGQIGFLAQVTGDKTVLRAAIERLQSRPYTARDFERPPMNEHQALAIEKFNQDIVDYFVDRLLADNPGLPRDAAIQVVHRRAQALLQQTGGVTVNTLQTLNSLIRSASQMSGRKLLFFISDGFLVDDQTANVTNTLRRIADTAARTGVVIYSIDARGLLSGSADSATEVFIDPTHRLTRNSGGEITATQEALRSLASDTGGRALLNINSLSSAANLALKETSTYYLLAWRPGEEQQLNKFRRIEVSVVGRPDLVVRVRRGYIEQEERANARPNVNVARRTEPQLSTTDALVQALRASLPLTTLPTSLFVSYADAPNVGTYITASMEVSSEALTYTPIDNKQTAIIDIAGFVVNDQGKPVASFQHQLRASPPAATTATTLPRDIVYNYQTKLKPGLYQVRVAARDSKSGRTGSAVHWIEIPDLSMRRLSLSSVVVGMRQAGINEPKKNEENPDNVFFSVSRRFTRNSSLRFLTHIYNAARSSTGEQIPDLALQVQIFRDNQPILTTALSKVETKGVQDLARLPYAAEIPLNLPIGRYFLQVTVIDRITKTSASQRVSFEIG
jgi:VWFA-related protein